MIDAEVINVFFRPTPIDNEPPEENRQYSEEQRQRQKELQSDLLAEQIEQM